MKVIKGLDLKKASQGKTTPLENFRVDSKNPNIKPCQSWNDYVMYQIKGTSKNGKPFATYEVVKVMRKHHGNELYVYVVDRLYRSNDIVSACKYMNNLRRRILPTETQKEIVRAHKDQYITRWKTFPSGKKFGYVALKYTDAIQRIADARKQQRSGSYTRRYSGNSGYSNSGNGGYRRGGYSQGGYSRGGYNSGNYNGGNYRSNTYRKGNNPAPAAPSANTPF